MRYDRMKKGLQRQLAKERFHMRTDCPMVCDEKANLNFIVWGDPQISMLSPLRSERVYQACEDIRNAEGVFDALVIVGDVTEYGAECEYRMCADLLSRTQDKIKSVYAVSGNHDVRLRRYQKQVHRFQRFLRSMKNGVAGKDGCYYYFCDVNGYRFIMMGADRSAFEASYISDCQIEWLDQKIASADPSKPVFVFNHQPLKYTNGLPVTFLGKGKWRGSVGRQSDRIRTVFEKYKNVVYITGHLHYGISKYTYEDCGRFDAVNVPTVGVINHGAFDVPSQGMVFSVYHDKIIVKSRIFSEGRYADEIVENAAFEINIGKERT